MVAILFSRFQILNNFVEGIIRNICNLEQWLRRYCLKKFSIFNKVTIWVQWGDGIVGNIQNYFEYGPKVVEMSF